MARMYPAHARDILRHCPIHFHYCPFPTAHYNTIAAQKWFSTCALGTLSSRSQAITIQTNWVVPGHWLSSSLSVIRPVSLQIIMTYWGNFSEHPIAPETGSPAYTRTGLAVLGLRINKPTQTKVFPSKLDRFLSTIDDFWEKIATLIEFS